MALLTWVITIFDRGGGLDRISIFRGCWERGALLLKGGVGLSIKSLIYLDIVEVTKKSDFQGSSRKTNIYGGLPKKGGLESLQI